MPTSLREKLKALRKQKGLSLDELARLSGASKSYLWELENRDERKPSAEKLVDIARVLDTTTDYLVDENASFDDAQMKEAFFRKFNKLDDDTKGRVMDMIETWGRKSASSVASRRKRVTVMFQFAQNSDRLGRPNGRIKLSGSETPAS